MKHAIILSMFLVVAAPALAQQEEDGRESTLFRVMGWTTYGTSAADLITTEYGLSHGAVELNPLAKNCLQRCATHALIPPIVNFTTAKLYRSGHKKTALWVRIGVTAMYSFVVVRNLRQF
jgi:hypothetical protein